MEPLAGAESALSAALASVEIAELLLVTAKVDAAAVDGVAFDELLAGIGAVGPPLVTDGPPVPELLLVDVVGLLSSLLARILRLRGCKSLWLLGVLPLLLPLLADVPLAAVFGASLLVAAVAPDDDDEDDDAVGLAA